MRSTRRCLALAMLLLEGLGTAAASAQEAPPEPARRNSLEANAWAIQFQITDQIGLKPFNGMMISLKRHFSPRSALRLGATVTVDYDDQKYTRTASIADTLAVTDYTRQKQNGQGVQLELLYLGYPNPQAPVNFFWGAGPLIGYSRSHREAEGTVTAPPPTQGFTRDSDAHAWRAGALGTVGVEWFATRGISFHAEYRARVTYGTSEVEEESKSDAGSTTRSHNDVTSWDLGGVEVLLGLSVYF